MTTLRLHTSFVALACSLCLLTANQGTAQQTSSPSNQGAGAQTVLVPRLVNFSGTLKDVAGKPHTGTAVLSFSLYDQQENGTQLWSETQTVQPDDQGHYTVQLGSTVPEGVPLALFTSGKSLWLGTQLEGESALEQPRVLLVSVPYALKAADADTLGGKPASAYVTIQNQAVSGTTPGVSAAPTVAPVTSPALSSSELTSPTACSSVTSDGTATVNSISLFTTPCNIESSPLFALSGKVGLATTAPSAYLDIYPTTTASATSAAVTAQAIRGNVTANPSSASYGVYEGVRGQANDFGATNRVGTLKGFVSATNTASNQTVDALYGLFSQAQVTKTGGTATAAYGIYANAVETTGNLTTGYGLFAQAQGTMGTAYGVYSSVTNYSSGKPTTGYGVYIAPLAVTGTSFGLYQGGASDKNYFAGNLGIGTTTPSAMLEVNGASKFDGAVTFAGGVTGNVSTGGQLISTVATGTAPLQVSSTTQVSNLNASLLGGMAASAFATTGANTFSGSQTINGNLNLPFSSANTGAIYIGGSSFLSGDSQYNSFLGYDAGNYTVTASGNSGLGAGALSAVTSGSDNTAVGTNAATGLTAGVKNVAVGYSSLFNVFSGSYNTAIGQFALELTYGSGNTALGSSAGESITSGSFNTLIGTNAEAASATLTNATAIGYNSTVGASDSLVLGGSYTDNNNVVHNTQVGIGTSTPDRPLAIEGTGGNSELVSFIGGAGSANPGTTVFHLNLEGGGLNFAETGEADGRLYILPGGTVGIDTTTPSSSYALDVNGDAHVSGTLYAGAKNFKIDDPIDPIHKDLYHASIESSEMMNLYTGNVTLDRKGRASVKLPRWFEALNKDFRYQLTAIGRPAPGLYVAQKIEDGQFVIAGGKPGTEISWQVTGVRHDDWAEAHPLEVEADKPARSDAKGAR